MWTLAKQAKLQSFRNKPSYILLYIVVCKICCICCISSCYNFVAKSYPMLDILLMMESVIRTEHGGSKTYLRATLSVSKLFIDIPDKNCQRMSQYSSHPQLN
jgi:hypothetical protein